MHTGHDISWNGKQGDRDGVEMSDANENWGQGEIVRGPGGLLPYRTEAVLAQRAVRTAAVLDEQAVQLVQRLCEIALRPGANPRAVCRAAACVAAFRQGDIARERNDTTERGQDLSLATAALRAALDTPEAAEHLARMPHPGRPQPLAPPQDTTSSPPDTTTP